jgi:hypothetical protein
MKMMKEPRGRFKLCKGEKGNVERTARSPSGRWTYLLTAETKAYFFQGKSAALKIFCKK